MDNQFFLNAGIPFDASSTPSAWRSLDAALHFPPQSSSDYNNNNNHHHFFDSAITSLASSPVSASNSAISNDSFLLRELIGKLGGICNSTEISPLSSPPKAGSTSSIMETFNTHLGNPISVPPLSSNLPAIPGDPAFAERAARFSPFGSRSFNGRGTTQFPSELHRVSSSPSINIGNGNGNLSSKNPRKRKSAPKGKCRDIPCSSSPAKAVENGDDSSAKRSKVNEEGNDEKTEEEDDEEDEIKKQSTSQKPPEAPKDYIHVRARRGQATDSHSLAERVRREKISERMKLLQDLVPGCNKVTGKALMLEEIINYVQSLQRQVEFLSMKVATINPRLDFNTDTLFQKDVSQPNCSMQQTHTTYPLDALAPTLYGGHQHPQNSLQQNGITGSGMGPPCPNPMDPINQNHDMQLPTIDGFNNGVSELQLCESDLHTIVQMGFAQNNNHVVQDNSFQSQSLQGSNQVPAMKSEF